MKNDNQTKFSIEEDQPSNWFEPLYAGSNKEGEGVPWANMKTHPSFFNWLSQHELDGRNKTALVVGCGLGDDAIELEARGFSVTAFDVSDTAIKLCKQRFPKSNVSFMQADLLAEQQQWHGKFDFVLEIYTVQALPPKYEPTLIQNISSFVSDEGKLLVVAEVDTIARHFDNGPPWLLTPQHIESFVSCGFEVVNTYIEQGNTDVGGQGTYVTTFEKQDK